MSLGIADMSRDAGQIGYDPPSLAMLSPVGWERSNFLMRRSGYLGNLGATETKWGFAMPEPEVLSRNQQGGISVSIDGVTCFAPRRKMSGAELRALPDQPIGRDRDLWQEVEGGLDQLIQPADKVDLAPQMRFFTVPRVINPGSPR